MIDYAGLLRNLVIVVGLSASLSAAESASRVGGLNAQLAVSDTIEGKRAAAELRAHFQADETRVRREQESLHALQHRLDRKHRLAWLPLWHTILQHERTRLLAEVHQTTDVLARDTQQLNAAVNKAALSRLRELAQHLVVAVQSYAKENGYSLIIDTGASPQPVGISPSDVTTGVIARYDELYSPAR